MTIVSQPPTPKPLPSPPGSVPLLNGRWVAGLIAVTAAYFATAKLGLMFATFSGNVSPVWPPTGLAIALALRFGYRVGIGVFLGATLVTLTTSRGISTAVLIGLGNSAETLLAVYFLRRYSRFSCVFTSRRDLGEFVFWAAMAASAVSATVGSLALIWSGAVPSPVFPSVWFTWWLGDAMGAVVVTPSVLALLSLETDEWNRSRVLEAVGMLTILTVLCLVVFVTGAPGLPPNSPLMFLPFPILLWSAVRFGWRGVGATVCLVAVFAIWATARNSGPLGAYSSTASSILLQAYLLILAASGQMLAVVATSSQRAKKELVHWRQIHEQAEEIADLGSWEWDAVSRTTRWSRQAFRIFGEMDGKTPGSLDEFLPRYVHPDDRDTFRQCWRRAFETGEAQQVEYRVTQPGGGERIVLSEGRVRRNDAGRVVGISGTVLDITERRAAESRLRESEERLRLALESTEDGLWDWNLVTGHFFVSPRMTAMLGYAPGEVAACPQSWWSLCHPDDVAAARERFAAHEAGSLPLYDHEYRIRHRKGDWVWVRGRAKVVARDAGGRPTRIIGTLLDITRQKLAEAALRDHVEMLRETEHLARIGGWELDLSTMRPVWSEEVRHLHEVDDAFQPTLKTAIDFFAPEARPVFARAVERAVAAGASWDLELPFITARGHRLWVRAIGRAKLAGGKCARVSATFQDITALKRAELLLRQEKSLLELVVIGYSLNEVLRRLALVIEGQAPGMACSILLASDDRKTLIRGAAPSLPEGYNQAVDGIEIGEGMGSCGTSAHRMETVIVKDIAADPLWNSCRDIALAHGLRACWSKPILSPEEGVLGTFAMYYREPRVPSEADRQLIERAVHVAGIAIERDLAARRIRESEGRLAGIIASAREAVICAGRDLRVTLFNPAAEKMFGCPASAALGRPLDQFIPSELTADQPAGETLPESPREVDCHRATGERFPAEASIAMTQVAGEPLYTAIIRDVTEREVAEAKQQKLEAELRRSQKLEAVGRLAGGIAHDFNNILGAIQGNAELLQLILGDGHPAGDYVDSIHRSCRRASDLIRQILIFSRQQAPRREPHHLSLLVAEGLKLQRASIPPQIRLESHLAAEPTPILADASQVHRVLLNLLVNAIFAMKERGGLLSVLVEPVKVDAALAARVAGLIPGNYARLSVCDEGGGMDEATLGRVFEPFFTTKPPGQGTGLGLAVVHGIVSDHQGAIALRSKVNEGTTVEIYFPMHEGLMVVKPAALPQPPTGNGERILLVDDEPELLRAGHRLLERLGYQPVPFVRPEEALAEFEKNVDAYDLIITDLTMSGMNGLELIERARAIRADIPAMLLTGRETPVVRENAEKLGVGAVLLKPVSTGILGRKIHQILNADGGDKPA